jgi:hypothetical protein
MAEALKVEAFEALKAPNKVKIVRVDLFMMIYGSSFANDDGFDGFVYPFCIAFSFEFDQCSVLFDLRCSHFEN